jgi:hypothetical protein
MTAKPWIARVGNREVYRAETLAMAQSMAVLKAPQGAERSLHEVKHEITREHWIGNRADDNSWYWTRADKPTRQAADPTRWPPPRHRADLDG